MSLLDPISEARIREILTECSEHAKGLTEFPARMSDGPGAVSTFYTSLSFADVIGLCNRALAALPPAGAGEVVVPRKKFPVLDSGGAKIDWGLVAEHAAQAQRNHSQTVPELAGRGGLAWTELYAVLHNKRFAMMDDNEAMIACRALETRYLAALASPDTTSRDSVIEECAKVADAVATAAASCLKNGTPGLKVYHQIYEEIATGIASDIRALSSHQTTGEGNG